MVKLIILLTLLLTTASIAQLNGIYDHPYPRTMLFTMERAGNPEYAAKFSICIMSPQDSATARLIHALSPHTYCLTTRNATQGWFLWFPAYDTVGIPDVWKLRTDAGALVHSSDGAYPIYNITIYCGRFSGVVRGFNCGVAAGLGQGETFQEFLSRVVPRAWSPAVWDGYSSDGTAKTPAFEAPTTNADIERNGTNAYNIHGSGWVTAAWEAGWNKMIKDARANLYNNYGGISRLFTYHSVQDSFGMSWYNGAGLENGMTHAPNTVTAWWALVDERQTNGYPPIVSWTEDHTKYDALHAPVRAHDYFRFIRFGLAYANLAGAYYNIGDVTDPHYSEHLWTPYYDEFDLKLGHPTGARQQIGSTGVWVRFFDNGCIIVNISNTTHSVGVSDISGLSGYAGAYYRFKGSQDPVMNDGTLFSTVNLISTTASWPTHTQNVGDAIFLLRTPTTIVSDIVIDNSYSATTPGNSPAVLVGTWNTDFTQPYPNKTWEISMPQQGGIPNWYYHMIAPAGSGSYTATYTPTINVSGNYKVYEYHGVKSGVATNTPYTITYSGGTSSGTINQLFSGNVGKWNLLGTFLFNVGDPDKLVVTNAANNSVIADAIKFAYTSSAPPPPPPPNPPVAPVQLTPTNSVPNSPTNQLFTWHPVVGALSYNHQVGGDSTFNSRVYSSYSAITDTFLTVPIFSNQTQYYWRMQTVTNAGTSSYSPVWTICRCH